MKAFKILGHPVFVCTVFLLILISGKSIGGFYLMYILLGLPHLAVHAIISTIGLLAMVIGYNLKPIHTNFKSLLYIVADVLMVIGLVTFFSLSRGYNDNSFEQTVPLISLIIFGLSLLSNVIIEIFHLGKADSKKLIAR